MACKRCGQCCVGVNVVLYGKYFNDDPEEQGKWFENHHCKIFPVEHEGNDVMGIRVPLSCKYLIFDTATGVAHCMDYDNRPQMCKDFICQSAQK